MENTQFEDRFVAALLKALTRETFHSAAQADEPVAPPPAAQPSAGTQH